MFTASNQNDWQYKQAKKLEKKASREKQQRRDEKRNWG